MKHEYKCRFVATDRNFENYWKFNGQISVEIFHNIISCVILLFFCYCLCYAPLMAIRWFIHALKSINISFKWNIFKNSYCIAVTVAQYPVSSPGITLYCNFISLCLIPVCRKHSLSFQFLCHLILRVFVQFIFSQGISG